ncbi:hypothetical protein HON22_05940 [Candidatus Peregrinibacteria bacterium]|jgi:hypothetical protein|nr:hypothetical protein [Candidatus Peregrinibacteria bacterium]
MDQSFYKYGLFIFCTLAIFFFGIFLGLIYNTQSADVFLRPIKIPEKKVWGTLEITQVSPLGVEGKVKGGGVRISNSREVLEVSANEEFRLSTSALYKSMSFVRPPSALFFASKRGKKYYSVKNVKQLEKMSPKNLLFFNTEKEALTSGYRN